MIKTSSAKAKGRELQKYVVRKILEMYPGLQADDVTSRSMGAAGEDVLVSPKARELFPYSVECKAHKAFAVYGHLDQAKDNCPEGAEPLLVIKGNRKEPLIVIDAEYFFKLIGRGK